MRDVDHPFDAIAHATQGETVRLTAGSDTVLIMPEPPPGHVVVTLDPDALSFCDRLRYARASYVRKSPAPDSPLEAMSGVLDQLPACLTCMDTGEHADGEEPDWCKCPAGAAVRAIDAARARELSDALRDVAPLIQEG
jgi:hypothetical protein